jgi:hypothetical protein
MTYQPFSAVGVPPDPAGFAAGLDAARHLLHARRHLEEADGALRLALDVPWDSPAAAAFRETLAVLRLLLDDERAVLDELRWRAAGRP